MDRWYCYSAYRNRRSRFISNFKVATESRKLHKSVPHTGARAAWCGYWQASAAALPTACPLHAKLRAPAPSRNSERIFRKILHTFPYSTYNDLQPRKVHRAYFKVCLTFVCVPNVPSFSCVFHVKICFSCVFHVKMRVFNTLNAWSRLECSERGFSESKILCE